MEKDFLNEIKNHMEVLNHEQVGYLLNIHSLYIANDSEEVQFMTGMTLEEWTFLRISKITNEKDFPVVLELIDLINQGVDESIDLTWSGKSTNFIVIRITTSFIPFKCQTYHIIQNDPFHLSVHHW